MLTTTLRPLTEPEKQLLAQRLPSRYSRWEQGTLTFVLLFGLLLLPLLLVKRFWFCSVAAEITYSLTAAAVAIGATWYVSARGLEELRSSLPTADSLVEVVHVRTLRAIRREDPEDFGVAYYLDVLVEGTPRVLFLWGQYLDELEYETQFPNTDFTYSRLPNSPEFLTFEVLGQYFAPEQTLPPFTKQIWRSGLYPVNGQLLSEPLDSVL
jgi:hypothetical protein